MLDVKVGTISGLVDRLQHGPQKPAFTSKTSWKRFGRIVTEGLNDAEAAVDLGIATTLWQEGRADAHSAS